MWGSKSRTLLLGVGGTFNGLIKHQWAKRSAVLESATIRQSHKHPTLCTITVDGFQADPKQPIQNQEYHWRLPNTDPRNEGKFVFRLHTLDLYFWKADDANAFISCVSKILEKGQVEVLDAPPVQDPHQGVTSPVVQKLESVAIQDPAYQNGQTRDSRTSSVAHSSASTASTSQSSARQELPHAEDPSAFKPLAYNPAAPPAPEPIKHREKTPPPLDAEDGTGLAAAAQRDHSQAFSPMPSPLPSQPPAHTSRSSYGQSPLLQGFSGPPKVHAYGSPHTSPPAQAAFSPPPAVQGQRHSSISSIPPPPQVGRNTVSPYGTTPSVASMPQSHQSAVSPPPQQSMQSFGPPPIDPNVQPYGAEPKLQRTATAEILGTSYVSSEKQPLQHLQPQYADYLGSRPQSQQPQQAQQNPPTGSYSTFDYSQQPQRHHSHSSQGSEYDVHNQFYRPTEEEAHKHRKHSETAPGQQPGRFEQRAAKVDKGVNRLFKRLEKNFG